MGLASFIDPSVGEFANDRKRKGEDKPLPYRYVRRGEFIPALSITNIAKGSAMSYGQ